MKVKEMAVEQGLPDESHGDAISAAEQEGMAEAELLNAMGFMLTSGSFPRRAHFDHFIICMAESVWNDTKRIKPQKDYVPF